MTRKKKYCGIQFIHVFSTTELGQVVAFDFQSEITNIIRGWIARFCTAQHAIADFQRNQEIVSSENVESNKSAESVHTKHIQNIYYSE